MLLQGRRVCVSLHACGPQLRLRPGLVALLEEWSARVVALLDAERELRDWKRRAAEVAQLVHEVEVLQALAS